MKYLLSLFRDETTLPKGEAPNETQIQKMLEPYIAFRAWCEENDVTILSGEALGPADLATTLTHGPENLRVTSDGPFLELKEQLGGFYLIECEHADKALAAAHQVPFLKGCELRPVIDYGV